MPKRDVVSTGETVVMVVVPFVGIGCMSIVAHVDWCRQNSGSWNKSCRYWWCWCQIVLSSASLIIVVSISTIICALVHVALVMVIGSGHCQWW